MEELPSGAARLSLRLIDGPAYLRDGLEAATREQIGDLAAADAFSDGGGWLDRLGTAIGGVLGLDAYARVARGVMATPAPNAFELDAFALVSIYGTVLWDDRAWQWHAALDVPDSAKRLRAVHDLALRAYRQWDEGARLVVVIEP